MKKMALILVVILTLALSSSPAFAAASSASKGAQDSVVSPMSLQFIRFGSSSIDYLGDSKIIITGETDAYQVCGTVGMTFYVDYWNGSSWILLNTLTYQDYYTDYYYQMIQTTLTKGFYYRLRTEHFVINNGIKETAWSSPSPIYVN